MLKICRFGMGALLLVVTSFAQALPLISIHSDKLSLSSRADLVDANGSVAVLEDSHSGTGYMANQEVDAINDWIYSRETYGGATVYEEFSVEANANIDWSGSGFNLWAESDKYPSGNIEDMPPSEYYTSIGLQASAMFTLCFDVSGGNVDVNYYVADEHVRVPGTYPPGYSESLSSIRIFDLTDSSWLVDVAGWYTGGYASLLDGHSYWLEAIARDDHFASSHQNEEDVVTGLYFGDAYFVSVEEPPSLLLLALGLLMIVLATGSRRTSGAGGSVRWSCERQ